MARQAAKQGNTYTQEERQAEYDKFMSEFARLGISEESFEEVKEFATKARDWVATGTAYNGSIPLVGLDRNLVYTLTTSKRNPVGVMLQNTSGVTHEQAHGSLERSSIRPPEPTSATEGSSQAAGAQVQKQAHKHKKIISGPRNVRAAQKPRPTGGSV
jgi:hypothetical protein